METQSVQQVDPAIIVRPAPVRNEFGEQTVAGIADTGTITLRAGHQSASSGKFTDAAGTSNRNPLRKQKLTAVLDPHRKVIVEGVDSTMEDFIEAVEDVLAQCRAARNQGIELAAFLAMLRDQAGL